MYEAPTRPIRRQQRQLHRGDFLAAPALACETDLVITLPRSAAHAFERSGPVVVFVPPVPPMRYTVHMIWSRHLDADPGHRWLRAQVLATAHAVQREADAGR